MTTSGMEADYDAHSEYQRRVVEGGDKLIRELVPALDLPAAAATLAVTDSPMGRGLLVAGTAPPDYDPQVVAVRTVIFLSAIPLSLVTRWAPLIWLLNTRVTLITGLLARLRRP